VAVKTHGSLADRFDRLIDRSDGCWIWRGSINNKGYGQIQSGGRKGGLRLAHRVSWEVHKGPVPIGKVVMHSCDNPPCVNPAHLKLGTQGDNLQDMTSKQRAGGQKLTPDQIEEIKATVPWPGYQNFLAEKLNVSQSLISYHRMKGK
jgi:HNH endonuclease